MSILLSEEQQAIATESTRVLEARVDLSRLLALVETTGEWDKRFWDTAVEQGWTAIGIPEAHGGIGLGLIELGLVAQACGAATAGAPFLTSGHGAVAALLGSDDAESRSLWLPRLADGSVTAAVAFAEGQQPLPASPTTIVCAGKLSGAKDGIPAGLAADLVLVWAFAGSEPCLGLVEGAHVVRTPIASFDNARLHADLAFAEVPIRVLATGDRAHALAHDVLARMAVVSAFEQVGGAEALMRTARDFALTRKAFGQPIGAFQSVKHRIAELYGLVEIARANCIHAASREGQPDFVEAAASARISATEAYDTAARDCIQIHGGIGVTWESGLHLHMRRARSLAIEQGNMLYWEDLLAERLTGFAA
ncbi:MAG: acyl-CoA dehydrogenase family protein [Novosphingobium sp.]|nr:acyl-CoA dehydrogenase family protein [Novosphingobium sp.]